MTSWHHNPCRKIHGWVWSAVFVHLMDGWLLIPGRFYTDAHMQAPLGQTGLWECFVFDRWQPKPSFHLSRCADMQRAFCTEQHRCRVNNSQSDSEKEQQRLALMSDVTYFQAEVGPHVQLNHLWLSKNFFLLNVSRLMSQELTNDHRGGFSKSFPFRHLRRCLWVQQLEVLVL